MAVYFAQEMNIENFKNEQDQSSKETNLTDSDMG